MRQQSAKLCGRLTIFMQRINYDALRDVPAGVRASAYSLSNQAGKGRSLASILCLCGTDIMHPPPNDRVYDSLGLSWNEHSHPNFSKRYNFDLGVTAVKEMHCSGQVSKPFLKILLRNACLVATTGGSGPTLAIISKHCSRSFSTVINQSPVSFDNPTEGPTEGQPYPDRPTISKLMEELKSTESQYGMSHHMIVDPCLGLAIAHIKQGRFAEAEKQCDRIFAILQNISNLEDVDEDGKQGAVVAECFLNLCLAHVHHKRNEKGLEWASNTQELLKRTPGSTEGRAFLMAMAETAAGMAYMGLEDFKLAAESAESALGRLQAALGPSHVYVAQGQYNLADTYVKLGRTQDAYSLMKQSLKSRQEVLGKGHPETVKVMKRMLGLSFELGDQAEGQKLFAELKGQGVFDKLKNEEAEE